METYEPISKGEEPKNKLKIVRSVDQLIEYSMDSTCNRRRRISLLFAVQRRPLQLDSQRFSNDGSASVRM